MTQLFECKAEQVRDLYIRRTRKRILIRTFINEWHSFRKCPQGWRVAFILTDGIAIYGVSTFGRPVARREDQERTLEHTRMALSSEAPRNSATFFMAQCRKWIRENMPEINRLISYVPAGKYKGITYLGDNWRVVYENQISTARWTNRKSRHDAQNTLRTKFEREP
jgi:hypothetical protein